MRSAVIVLGLGLAVVGACASRASVAPLPPAPKLAAAPATRAVEPLPATVATVKEEPAQPQAKVEPPAPPAREPDSACNDQTPHDFLIRGSYFPKGDAEEMKR